MPFSSFEMDLLNRKYAIEQQNANTAAAQVANTGAFNQAQISHMGAASDPLSLVQQQLLQAQAREALAHAAGLGTQASVTEDENLRNQKTFDQGFNSGVLTDYQQKQIAQAYNQQNAGGGAVKTPGSNKKGLAVVPKTGNTKVHKGEAILNKPAADKMGRGLIAAMNVMGQQKMGMV